jgi:hypothetical protein
VAWTEDLSVFFNADAPSSVTVSFTGSVTGMIGIMGAPGELALGSDQLPGVQQTDRTVLIRTDQKGSLLPGSSITVAGTVYAVRYLIPIEDGLITLVYLR